MDYVAESCRGRAACIIIPGKHGERGDRGEDGKTGPKGGRGETGEVGPKGKRGCKGDKGDTGPRGERGCPGGNLNAAVICAPKDITIDFLDFIDDDIAERARRDPEFLRSLKNDFNSC